MGDKAEELAQIQVSIEKALEQIDTLSSKKSPGTDGIHWRFITEPKYKIAKLLTVVSNLLPEEQKVGNVTPIFMKDSREILDP